VLTVEVADAEGVRLDTFVDEANTASKGRPPKNEAPAAAKAFLATLATGRLRSNTFRFAECDVERKT